MIEILSELVDALFSLLSLIFNSIKPAIDFIILLFGKIPNFIYDCLNELPFYFKYGLEALIGIVIFITILRIVQLLKFSKWGVILWV